MLPIPNFYSQDNVGVVYRVDYAQRAAQAQEYRSKHALNASNHDQHKTWLLLIDVQNTFCIPNFELFVGGRSGTGAVEDNRRLCEFIYHNLSQLTQISATLDTHSAMQIFHPIFFINQSGAHPQAYTELQVEDLTSGNWRFNPQLAPHFGITPEYGQEMALHYAKTLAKKGKFALTIWPYHAMLGGIGHALVSAVEEAIFFHSLVRLSPPEFSLKGDKAFSENYSAIGPEVLSGPHGESLGLRNSKFIQQLKQVDRLIIAGQAKSHCVAWTISDLLEEIQADDPRLADKVYLLADCSSPVVVPGLVDHTDAANAAFARFAAAGMHIVASTSAIDSWPS